jgi:hypothetical protein
VGRAPGRDREILGDDSSLSKSMTLTEMTARKAVADAPQGTSGQETSDQSMNRVGGRTTAVQKGPSSSGSDQAR